MNRFAAIALLPVIAACAPGPDAIAPVSMGAAYAAHDCRRVSADLAAERQNLVALEAAQRGAQVGDAVGVFLLGIPTSSLTGGNKAGDVGASKGKVIALEARAAACGGA